MRTNLKASALVYTLILLAIMVTISATVASTAITSRKSAAVTGSSTQAFATADSGMEQFLAKFQAEADAGPDTQVSALEDDFLCNPESGNFYKSTSGEGKSTEITLLDIGGEKIPCNDTNSTLSSVKEIKSTGTNNGTLRAVQVAVAVEPPQYLYLMTRSSIVPVDFSDQEKPEEKNMVSFGGRCRGASTEGMTDSEGDFLYAVCIDGDPMTGYVKNLNVIDISNPAIPKYIASESLSFIDVSKPGFYRLATSNGYVFITDYNDSKVHIYKTDLSTGILTGSAKTIKTNGRVLAVAVKDGYAYVSSDNKEEIYVIEGESAQIMNTFQMKAKTDNLVDIAQPSSLAASDGKLFIAGAMSKGASISGSATRLEAWDISGEKKAKPEYLNGERICYDLACKDAQNPALNVDLENSYSGYNSNRLAIADNQNAVLLTNTGNNKFFTVSGIDNPNWNYSADVLTNYYQSSPATSLKYIFGGKSGLVFGFLATTKRWYFYDYSSKKITSKTVAATITDISAIVPTK